MPNETIQVSKCCKAHYVEHQDSHGKDFFVCVACKGTCEITEVCAYCLGTGEVDKDETDSDGNVARGTLTEKCVCQLSNSEDEYEHE